MGRFGSVTLRAVRFGALAMAVLASGPAPAQDNANLPGGASSLRETHGDWIVACGLQNAGGKNSKICAPSEELTDTKSPHLLAWRQS